jgi:hypothetical protein
MRATLTGRTATLAAACGSTAVVTGLLLAKLEPQWSIAGILGFLGVAIVYYDYRLGLPHVPAALVVFFALTPNTRVQPHQLSDSSNQHIARSTPNAAA